MGHLRRTAVAAAVLMLAGLGIAAPATAARPAGPFAGEPVPGGFGSWPELLATQDRLNAAGARVAALGLPGFAGLVADPVTRELRVYWKGAPPAGLPADVPLRVLPAAYSKRELRAAAARVLDRDDARVTMVAPRPDGSGLRVGTVGGAAVPAAGWAGVPVTLEEAAPAAGTRVDDAAPWSGGARWTTARGFSCSTGFAVRQSGANRMLSAAHCAETSDAATDPTGEQIGSVGSDVETSDVLVIDGEAQARIYVNTFDALGGVVTEFTSAVVGSRANVVGNLVCTSGSFSGSRCRISVTATDVCINLRNPIDGTVLVCGQVEADQLDGLAAAGQGDSGGPVVSFDGSDTGRAFAQGTFSGGDDNRVVACRGYVTVDRTCWSRIYYEDIAAGLGAAGATLRTS